MANYTKLSSLCLQGWRQFENVEIKFHDRLTILTGANGAGKSSIIRIISKHFGFERAFLATPILINGQLVYKQGLYISLSAIKEKLRFIKNAPENIGIIEYQNGVSSSIRSIDNHVAASLEIPTQQPIAGIHIDSHQPISNYQTVSQIPSGLLTPESAYNIYQQEVSQRYHGGAGGSSPLYRMKESIIGMAVFGEGNSRTQGNPILLNTLNGFIEVLRNILPPSLGFLDLSVRPPEVVIQTQSGEFIIDAASGGIATIIDLSWRLYLFSLNNSSFVVTIDEPENHLHPSMQRSILGRLVSAFPNAQFIVATHSPFIVTSVKESAVYVLRYSQSQQEKSEGVIPETTNRRVVSEELDTINKASSANKILREVLEVEETTPEWLTTELNAIIQRYTHNGISSESLLALREELTGLGYQDHYPYALSILVDRA